MIISFGSKETEAVWNGERARGLPVEIQQIARRKLRMLNSSISIADLKIPQSSRPEKLSGRLREYHSIRINDQWRIIFIWSNGNAYHVKLTDYH